MEDSPSPQASSVTSEPSSDSKSLMTRRQVIISASSAAGSLTGGTVLTRIFSNGQTQALTPSPQVYVANLNSLQVGTPLAFDYPQKGLSNYLIKLGKPAIDGVGPEGDVIAFSTICSDSGGALVGRYQDVYKVLGPCPCHLSIYDLTLGGTPVIGTCTENLAQIELSLDADGNIFAKGVWFGI